MTKMTLVSNRHPAGVCILAAVDGDGPFSLFEGVETEVNVKRALCYIGDSDFELKFNAAELNGLTEAELQLGVQLLQVENGTSLVKKLLPKSTKKTTTQKVIDTATIVPKTIVNAVTSTATPTTTNDQSEEEATLADESE